MSSRRGERRQCRRVSVDVDQLGDSASEPQSASMAMLRVPRWISAAAGVAAAAWAARGGWTRLHASANSMYIAAGSSYFGSWETTKAARFALVPPSISGYSF